MQRLSGAQSVAQCAPPCTVLPHHEQVRQALATVLAVHSQAKQEHGGASHVTAHCSGTDMVAFVM